MKKFNFNIDQKVSIWHRTSIDIEANSLEEAKEKLRVFGKKEYQTDEVSDILAEECDSVDYDSLSTEYLYDTVENISIEENQGNSTIEVMYEEKVIFRNNEDN